MALISWMLLLDKWWMKALNSIGSASAAAFVFRLVTDFGGLIYVWLAAAFIAFIATKRRSHAAIILAALASVLVAEVATDLIKVAVGRLRPFMAMPDIVRYGALEKSYSFPSGHASRAFASAAVLSAGFKRLRPLWYVLAFAIALSRVVLGLHYPSDVIFGALLGYGCGLAFAKFVKPSSSPRQGACR